MYTCSCCRRRRRHISFLFFVLFIIFSRKMKYRLYFVMWCSPRFSLIVSPLTSNRVHSALLRIAGNTCARSPHIFIYNSRSHLLFFIIFTASIIFLQMIYIIYNRNDNNSTAGFVLHLKTSLMRNIHFSYFFLVLYSLHLIPIFRRFNEPK